MLAWTDKGNILAGNPLQNIGAVTEAQEGYIPAGKECTGPPVVNQRSWVGGRHKGLVQGHSNLFSRHEDSVTLALTRVAKQGVRLDLLQFLCTPACSVMNAARAPAARLTLERHCTAKMRFRVLKKDPRAPCRHHSHDLLETSLQQKGGAVDSFPKGNMGDV
jgi:hypothetical protein